MRTLILASRYVVAVAIAIAASGCNFENPLATLFQSGGSTQVSFTARANPHNCSLHGESGIECEYFPPYSSTGSTQVNSFADLIAAFAALLGFFDPLVVQVPAEATAFTGTLRNSQGSAALAIFEPSSPLRVDSDRSYAVEPGKKLVVIEFPPGHALAAGDNYFFTLTFSLPGQVDRLELKALFAGRVDSDGVVYYPPLAPCQTDFSQLPSFAIGASSTPVPISLNALRQVRGCSGSTAYRFRHAPPPGAVEVVEYYSPALDHYFVTWLQGEIAALDAGTTIRGWQRTGYTFTAWPSAQPGTSPVCRFYLPPQFGDSHFYGRGTTECDSTAQRFPGFTLEATEFMHLALPANGVCPAGTYPVYRTFSNRGDANHRYSMNRRVRDHMGTRGWVAEGDGPDLVVMCAP